MEAHKRGGVFVVEMTIGQAEEIIESVDADIGMDSALGEMRELLIDQLPSNHRFRRQLRSVK